MATKKEKVKIPDSILSDHQKLAKLIVSTKRRIKAFNDAASELKDIKDQADEALEAYINSQGLKKLDLKDVGQFIPKETTYWSFPKEDDGGRDAAVNWLESLMEANIVDTHTLLSLQQARIVSATIDAIVQEVERHNEENPDNQLPATPFSSYVKKSLTSPT